MYQTKVIFDKTAIVPLVIVIESKVFFSVQSYWCCQEFLPGQKTRWHVVAGMTQVSVRALMMILVETICSSYTWLHTLHKLAEVLEFWDRNNTADGMYMNVQYCKIQQLNKCDPQHVLALKYKAQSWVLWIRLCWIVTKNNNLLLFCRCVGNADLIPYKASQLSLRITVCWTIRRF